MMLVSLKCSLQNGFADGAKGPGHGAGFIRMHQERQNKTFLHNKTTVYVRNAVIMRKDPATRSTQRKTITTGTVLTILIVIIMVMVYGDYSIENQRRMDAPSPKTRSYFHKEMAEDDYQTEGNERTEHNKPTSETRPHILFILADDLGYNDVGFHNPYIISPNIDELATTGVRLENYYVANLCSPSRAQLLTGRYGMRTGINNILKPQYDHCLSLKEVTMADILQKAGYSTHLVGKWHLGYSRKECTPTHRGFDTFLGFLSGSECYYRHLIQFPQDERKYSGYDFYDNERVAYEYKGEYSTHIFARRTIDIIEQHNTTQPLFIFLSLQSVHIPWDVPDNYIKQNEHFEDKTRRTFAGMVTCMDEAIGNITRSLKKTGMWDNTVMIFSTDNGGPLTQYDATDFMSPETTPTVASNWPLRGGKATDWEGGVRGAAFVHSPLLNPRARGTENKNLMGMVDWLPTLAGFLGKGDVGDQTIDGHNVWHTISDGSASPRHELVHNVRIHKGTVYGIIRVGDWKLFHLDEQNEGVVNFNLNHGLHVPPPEMNITLKSTRIEPNSDYPYTFLFNMRQDPRELRNLVADHPDIVKQMKDRLVYYSQFIKPYEPPIEVNQDEALKNGTIGPWL